MNVQRMNGSEQNVPVDSASAMATAIREGRVSSEELVDTCLKQIDLLEDEILAWAYLDHDLARAQAVNADKHRQQGRPLGPLHGVPIAIKDIIDTTGMPTEYNSPIFSGRKPGQDATLVSLLREAGAIILGKTVTTEFALLEPAKTKNPHNTAHTPGGSSSGSAAAVAAGMVPLSIGTQTGGSVIRPASFCGIYGFKPSHGRVSRHRVLRHSDHLDTVGMFARSLDDTALLADVLLKYDSRDPEMRMVGRPHISEIMMQDPPADPKFAFVRTPFWERMEDSSKDAFRELLEHIGKRVDLVTLPNIFDDAGEFHRRIMEADIARGFERHYRDSKDLLSNSLRDLIERGQQVLATDYLEAVDRVADLNDALELMLEDYDAIITPSAPGEAPEGLSSTGDPAFCKIWTLCGVPALNLPILQGPNGLPLGVQLVSYKDDDARLFRTARWLLNSLEE